MVLGQEVVVVGGAAGNDVPGVAVTIGAMASSEGNAFGDGRSEAMAAACRVDRPSARFRARRLACTVRVGGSAASTSSVDEDEEHEAASGTTLLSLLRLLSPSPSGAVLPSPAHAWWALCSANETTSATLSARVW
jgi:hypothetical protein